MQAHRVCADSQHVCRLTAYVQAISMCAGSQHMCRLSASVQAHSAYAGSQRIRAHSVWRLTGCAGMQCAWARSICDAQFALPSRLCDAQEGRLVAHAAHCRCRLAKGAGRQHVQTDR